MVELIIKWGDDSDANYVIPCGKTLDINWNRYAIGNFVLVKSKGWDGDDKANEIIATHLKGRLVVNRPELFNDWVVVMFCIPENPKLIAAKLSDYLDENCVERMLNEVEDATSFHIKTSAPEKETGAIPVKRPKRKLEQMSGSELVDHIPLFSHIVHSDEIIKKNVKKLKKLRKEMSELITEIYAASQIKANEIEHVTKKIK